MSEKKIYFFIGTTAELIKIAPIIRKLEKRKIQFKLISSGQNHIRFESVKGFINKQKADIEFPEKINKSSLFFFFLWAMKIIFSGTISLRTELQNIDKQNTFFIIQGDTVSSTIGGLIAKLYHIPLVHIESGDLSFNFFEPFPEEICKNINSRLADILFPPTEWARNNLKKIKKPKICTINNTNIETFWWGMKQNKEERGNREFKKYYVLIMHRQEHVIFKKDWSKDIMEFVIKHSDPSLTCVILNHPLSIEVIKNLALDADTHRIEILPLLPYHEFLQLLQHAEFIASDSATLQQEAYYMGKPLLGLCDYSVQIEGIGQNYVLSKGNTHVIKDFLRNYKQYQTKPVKVIKKPSTIIVDYLLNKNT